MKKFIVFFMIIITMVLTCSGCIGKNPEKALVGRWNGTIYTYHNNKSYKNAISYSFYENGNYDQFYTNEDDEWSTNPTNRGKWSIVDENTLRLDEFNKGVIIYEFKLDGDTLILDGHLLDNETLVKE